MKCIFLLLELCCLYYNVGHVMGKSVVPILSLDPKLRVVVNKTAKTDLEYLPFIMLIDKEKDTSEYWRETEILSLVRNSETNIDYEKCEQSNTASPLVQFPSLRTVRPICRSRIDFQLCPQCPHYSNYTECELFRDSCKERKVHPSEYNTYCDRKYGKWRAMFVPADYSECRCCDECIFYRELDQSCMHDDYDFDAEEFLPVTTLDFRAGCNQYWGHPEQELKALRCDKILRRCVPVSVPPLPNETLNLRHNYRYEPSTGGGDCPISCRGYQCPNGQVTESQCTPGAFLPDKEQCNCCGKCSAYQQLNEKCAEFNKTVEVVNGTEEIELTPGHRIARSNFARSHRNWDNDAWGNVLFTDESRKDRRPSERYAQCNIFRREPYGGGSVMVEEEFLEPGCDDGLVCRQGKCQDIHVVETTVGGRRKRDEWTNKAKDPCKKELKYFKKKYGPEGHMHYDAPQCTPLWLYAPVQCRRFVCYCALEDGSIIVGIKVPRVEVSNMNCDCAREKCRTGSDVECDGYGNYKEAVFIPHVDEWTDPEEYDENTPHMEQFPHRTTSYMS